MILLVPRRVCVNILARFCPKWKCSEVILGRNVVGASVNVSSKFDVSLSIISVGKSVRNAVNSVSCATVRLAESDRGLGPFTSAHLGGRWVATVISCS